MPKLIALLALAALSGCSLVVDRVANNASENLQAAILEQDDPAVVRDGAPAFLLILDSFVQGSPDDPGSLSAAADLYTAYAALFVDDPERAKVLSARARDYGERALCARDKSLCGLASMDFATIEASMQRVTSRQLPELFSLTTAWLVYIRAHSDDWTAIADLPKVEACLARIVALDDTYENGSVHAYLGILKTLRPPALGGKPDEARIHFERAIEISGGKDLSFKVEYARGYARLLYERELHDQLLTEVVEAEPRQPRLTLTNTIAQRDARALLDSADDYF